MRSKARRRTDLVIQFDPLELQARLAARGRVDHKGVDAKIHCRKCKWKSTAFPYDPWVVRGFAEQHFDYEAATRAYRCKG